MINSMRGCVACDDLWPWPISSRSFGLDLENRVRFVASTVLDGFFSYLAQMITINRGCVACYVFFRIRKFEFLANFWNFSALTLKKKSSVLNWFFPYLAQMITSKRRCVAYNDLWPWPISSRSFGLGLENRVRSVASTVLDGFFPYLIQMITSMRRCVACDDLWPWPISSRSFDLDFENRVHSVASTVLDGFFWYLAQMIAVIRGCVKCCVFFRICKFEFLANFWNFLALTLKKKSTVLDRFFPCLAQMITSMRGCVAYNEFWPWPISSRSFGLGLENHVRSVASTVRDGFFLYLIQTRQIRTSVLRIPPAVTSQAKMKNWLHECQKWVSHMIGQYAHIQWGRTLIFNPMQDHDPSDISTKNFLNPLKRMRVIIRTSTDGVG